MEKLQTKVDGSKPSSLKSVLLALFILVGWFIVPLNPWISFSRESLCRQETHPGIGIPRSAKALVETLRTLNASAYITEPGANALYYANVSSSYWHLSERPLLVAITPKVQADGTVEPQLVVLAPKFEAARANLLDIPFDNIRYEYWPEEANPYQILVSALSISEGKIFVDGSIRHFIVDGLQAAYGQGSVVSAPQEVNRLRERKSAAERELLKCANEATLLALRAVHKKMYIGMRESEAGNMMASALTAVGLQNGECLTLFGENAALPHGGGTDRELGESDFALFDCKGTLHEYWSDLTRTVALPDTVISVEASKIWQLVRIAQNSALSEARKGVVAKSVDEAARRALSVFGYAKYFTHRLGHGIGLEVHEGPYLNGGSEDILDTGHTFSDEPGIYIEGKIGVRLEDCFYIDEQSGSAVLFTEGVGGQAKSVLEP